MEMHFTIPGDQTPKAPQPQPRQPQLVPISRGLSAASNRPPSLLSRGRSFTSDDLLADDANANVESKPQGKGDGNLNDTDMGDDSDHSSSLMSAGFQKSVSSDISNITNSPPSSLSSQSIAEDIELDLDHDADVEPFTPLHQTSFPSSVHEVASMDAQSATPKAQAQVQVQVESATPHAPNPDAIAADSALPFEQITSPRGKKSSITSQSAPARKGFHGRILDGPEQPAPGQGQTKRQKVTTPSHPSHGRGQSTSSSPSTGTGNGTGASGASLTGTDVFGPAL